MVDTIKVESGKPGKVDWDFINAAGTVATVDTAQVPVTLMITLGAVLLEPALDGSSGKWHAEFTSAVAGLCEVSVNADVDLGGGQKVQTFPLIIFDFPGDNTASGVGNVVGSSG